MGTGSLTGGCHDSSLPMHMASLVLVFLSSGCGLSTSHYYRDHASSAPLRGSRSDDCP